MYNDKKSENPSIKEGPAALSREELADIASGGPPCALRDGEHWCVRRAKHKGRCIRAEFFRIVAAWPNELTNESTPAPAAVCTERKCQIRGECGHSAPEPETTNEFTVTLPEQYKPVPTATTKEHCPRRLVTEEWECTLRFTAEHERDSARRDLTLAQQRAGAEEKRADEAEAGAAAMRDAIKNLLAHLAGTLNWRTSLPPAGTQQAEFVTLVRALDDSHVPGAGRVLLERLRATENDRDNLKRDLDLVHGYIFDCCRTLGVNTNSQPADAWTLREKCYSVAREDNTMRADLEAATKRAQEAEAGAAVMRQALERIASWDPPGSDSAANWLSTVTSNALADDTGRAFLERLRATETTITNAWKALDDEPDDVSDVEELARAINVRRDYTRELRDKELTAEREAHAATRAELGISRRNATNALDTCKQLLSERDVALIERDTARGQLALAQQRADAKERRRATAEGEVERLQEDLRLTTEAAKSENRQAYDAKAEIGRAVAALRKIRDRTEARSIVVVCSDSDITLQQSDDDRDAKAAEEIYEATTLIVDAARKHRATDPVLDAFYVRLDAVAARFDLMKTQQRADAEEERRATERLRARQPMSGMEQKERVAIDVLMQDLADARAALGRAVAALRNMRVMQKEGYSQKVCDSIGLGDERRINGITGVAKVISESVDAILTDPTCAAAGDAWRELVRCLQLWNEIYLAGAIPAPITASGLHEAIEKWCALAKVDARRGS